METLIRDLKHAFRLLLRAPAFTVTAVSALALGIGANTAIFSVINTVLLRPLPFPDPDRIVQIMNSSPNGTGVGASVPKYNVWREQTAALEDITAYDLGGPGINLSTGDRPEQVKGIHVSHEFFRLFGAPLALGRSFTREEDLPGGGNIVVLSHGLWQRRFGGDPGVVGKAVSLGGEPHTIIGVVGAGFSFDPQPDLYLPFQANPSSTQQAHFFRAAARLKAGVNIQTARAVMSAAAEEFKRRNPGMLGPRSSFTVEPMQQIMVRNVRRALLVLLGAVGFVLSIACANVANLSLARAAARSREIAIRATLGAGRGRIIRQLLTESVLIALIGGALGLALGVAGVRGLLAVNPADLPRIGEGGAAVALDGRVLAFTFVLSLATGILFGLVPAFHAARADLNLTLKEGGRTGSGGGQTKARSLLVVVEMALAIVLLCGAGLLIRTFAALHSVSPGFDARNVLTLQTSLTGSRYDRTAGIFDLARRATERIEALPGARAAAASSYLPLEGGLGLPFIIEGRPLENSPVHGGAGWAYVTHRFFEVFKIRVVRGRGFTERDDAAAPGVVVINEAFARQYWPKGDPVGARLRIGPGMGPAFAEAPREIVGVVSDARDAGLNNDPQPEMFVPLGQVRDAVMALNNRFMPLSWVVRADAAPPALSSPVQRVFQDLADLPVARVRSMEQIVGESTARTRFNTLLLAVFAFVAILLASIGLYGVMAYTVEQRTHEFGIRLALGADPKALRNLIVRKAMKLALAGIVIGTAGALGLTRYISTMLFAVTAQDPVVFVSVGLLLGTVAFLASYLPARRATGIDPVVALRYE
jgi:putative ABC transport system permease protein